MSSEPQPIYWERLPWPEVAATLEACGQTVLWPFGATEQHGPHLGLGTDTVIARSLAEAVSAITRVPVLPTLPLGMSAGHSTKWPGTLSLRPSTLARIVSETGGWLYQAGVRRLILLNAHVTNAAPLRCGLEELRATYAELAVALIPTAEISPRVREIHFADGADWHANAAETSLMLHLDPKSVFHERIEDDPDRTLGLEFAHPVNHTSTNGVTGRPSKGTAAQGAELFSWMVEDLSARVRRAMHETPPLP